MVLGLAVLDSHGSLQVVVAPLQASAQLIVVGQGEDAFQVSHRTTLVTLQLLVVREVRIVGREPALRIVAVGQGDGRKIIVVRVTVPVDIERQLIGLIEFPQTAGCQSLVTVLQVVSLHVDGSILAAGAVDAFPVGAALGIEFQSLHRLKGQSF